MRDREPKVDGDKRDGATAVLARAGPGAKRRVPARRRQDGDWKLVGGSALHVATVVVKLGSSIVADDAGEVRADVLGRALRRGGRPPRAPATQVVIVTSGAIARGHAR